MSYQPLISALVGALLSVTAVQADPLAGTDDPLAGTDTDPAQGAQAEVWGDPEESGPASSGWTWFGMGYESRMGTPGDTADAAAASGGSGGGQGSGQGQGRK